MNSTPRPEYPRPQFERESFLNLNGEWEFEFDFGSSGVERELYKSDSSFSQKINVPFCPESKLSGIEYKDFMRSVWYKRSFNLQKGSGRTLLHFGAVDYECTVWINKTKVGYHKGGYSSFCFDITDAVIDGSNTVCVYAFDPMIIGKQPMGKQSNKFYSAGCHYTRTTGIWQTVWIEQVSDTYIGSVRIDTAQLSGVVNVEAQIVGPLDGVTLELAAFYEGKAAGECTVYADCNTVITTLNLKEAHLWEVNKGGLYEIEYTLKKNGKVIDSAKGYFGLRTVSINNGAICINGVKVFQRLVLDQGFYPDGIYTAPTDGDLKNDILLSQALGFNGARMHERVFEERYIYWADKLGYILWGEFANWGLDCSELESVAATLPEWLETMKRDYSHPAIVGWCPFNETWDFGEKRSRQDPRTLEMVYNVTKSVDRTRPVIDTSGNYHVVTDIFDTHCYEQDPEKLREMLDAADGEVFVTFPDRQSYNGQPYFVSEYGGTWWAPGKTEGWGYGNTPKTETEVIERIVGLTTALLECKYCCALCYTQIYDVEQEQNGLYTYDRKKKFSDESYARIKAATQAKACIEE